MSIQNNEFSYLEDLYPESIRLYKSICEEITYYGTGDKQIYPCCRPVDIDEAKERYEWRYIRENNIPNGSILIYILDWESMFQNALKILLDSKLVNLCWNNESLFLTLNGYSEYVYYILGSMPDSIKDAGFFLNPSAIMDVAISKQGEYKSEHKGYTPIEYANYMYSHPISHMVANSVERSWAEDVHLFELFAELSELNPSVRFSESQINDAIDLKIEQIDHDSYLKLFLHSYHFHENNYLRGKWTCGVLNKNNDGTYSVTTLFIKEFNEMKESGKFKN